MLNHARTLLVNAALSGVYDVGDEIVPASFTPVELPTSLATVRSVIFGAAPDRLMLNYRAAQLLPILHAGPTAGHLRDLDPRVTYLPPRDDFFDVALYTPTAVMISGDAHSALYFTGGPEAPDDSGRMRHELRVDVLTSETASVFRSTPPQGRTIYEYTYESGITSAIPLAGTGYTFRLSKTDTSQLWAVTVVNRPTRTPADVLDALTSVGEPVLLDLFGVGQDEPYRTFRNLWQTKAEPLGRLAAAVTALIYRTEELRG
jgi:hypothetical protein